MSNTLARSHALTLLGMLSSSLVLSSTALATDDNKLNSLLSGSYSFSLSQACVQSAGFESDGSLSDEGQILHYADYGKMEFDGVGNMKTLNPAKVIELNTTQISAGQIPVNSGLTSDCKGTYQVKQDRSYSAEITCEADLQPPLKLRITPFRFEGQIGFWGQTLNLSGTEGNVETITISIGNTILNTSERICLRSGTLVKML